MRPSTPTASPARCASRRFSKISRSTPRQTRELSSTALERELALLQAALRYPRRCEPRVIVVENVTGMLRAEVHSYFGRYEGLLRQLDSYSWTRLSECPTPKGPAAAGGRREGRDRFDGRRSGPEALAIEGDRWQRSVGAGRRAGAARTAGPSLRLAPVVRCAWEAYGVDAPPSDGGLPASERDRRDMTPSNQWCIVP